MTPTSIPFNRPLFLKDSYKYIEDAVQRGRLCGDGFYTSNCHDLLEKSSKSAKVFLTTSCTMALEMCSLLCDIKPGDEVIVPSFAFVTTASAFALRGAKLVFVDIRPDTLNIDETKIEAAITDRTKIIVPLHYAGVSCEMDAINALACKYNLFVVEDAAQAITSTYDGKVCGSIGDFGCYSFHETKNISCGEGGALLINRDKYIHYTEIVREKGTNRANFFRGQVDKYTWLELGSSFLASDILAACLYPQLLMLDDIMTQRMSYWQRYHDFFEKYEAEGLIRRPIIPCNCTHNAHMYYLLWPNIEQRTDFINYMKSKNITTVFHYQPLHKSPAGQKYGYSPFADLPITDKTSDTLVRLPLYYDLGEDNFNRVIQECRLYMESL